MGGWSGDLALLKSFLVLFQNLKNRMICSPRSFLLLASDLLGPGVSDRRFRAHFGCSPDVCSDIWEKISRSTPGLSREGAMPKHLLWALNFLKSYDTEDILAARFGTTRVTLRKWIWFIVRRISCLKRRVVSTAICETILVIIILTRRLHRSNGRIAESMEGTTIDGLWLRSMEQTV